MLKDLLSRTIFHDLAVIHNDDAVRNIADSLNIVRNKNHRETQLRLEVSEQVQDLRANRNVQCGSRLISNDCRWVQRKRACNCNTLTLTTRELTRKGAKCGMWKSYQTDKLINTGFSLRLCAYLMHEQWIHELVFNNHTRVKSSCWVLEDNRDNAANLLSKLWSTLGNIHSLEVHMTRRW